MGDSKKFVYDDDLSAIVDDSLHASTGLWELDFLQFVAGSHARPGYGGTAQEGKKFEQLYRQRRRDTVIKAIERITKRKGTLKGYSVNAAGAERTLGRSHGSCGLRPAQAHWQGASTDVIEASPAPT